MAQTLEELFKSKQLVSQGGKTAEEVYAVRNSKDIRISTSDPLINNTGFGPARLLRKTLGVKGSETFLEEEATGLRIIRGFSTPVIYGNEISRITLRTTPVLDSMKTATSGEVADGGLIGGKLTKLRNNINSKLGIPQAATPTFVVNGLNNKEQIPQLELTQNRMIDLAKIKNSAEGSLLGKLLKDGGGGNLKTIGKQALGSAIKLGKDALRKKLFGDGERTGLQLDGFGVSSRTNDGVVYAANIVPMFTEDSVKNGTTKNTNYGSLTPTTTPTDSDKKGARYSKTISVDPDSRQDLSTKQQLQFEPIRFTQEPERVKKFSQIVSKDYVKYDKSKNLDNSKRGFYTTKDSVNALGITDGNYESYPQTNDDLDFVPLRFYSIANEKTVQFRCTVTGLSETFSPQWDNYKFLGSPFNNYTYVGIERSVTFNFKVYSLNANEQKNIWNNINFLTGLVYPQGYATSTALTPPFIRFTLGDLFKNKTGFIESLNYNYEDGTPWNISNKESAIKYNNAGQVDGVDENINMVGYRLPMIVDIAATIKFVEGRKDYPSTEGTTNKFFTFEPMT